MTATLNEDLLRQLCSRGEMDGRDLVGRVHRTSNDYTDFYGLAAMIHSGYIATDTTVNGERGLGQTLQDTAVILCQLSLAKGESFSINNCPRERFTIKVTFFITGDGVLKLEQLDEKRAAKSQKRRDYAMTAIIATSVALLSSTATHLLTLHRMDVAASSCVKTETPAATAH